MPQTYLVSAEHAVCDSDRGRALAQLDLFAGLSPELVQAATARFQNCAYRRGQLIASVAPCDVIYLVTHGVVRVFQVGHDGRELTSGILRHGDFFGIPALLDAADSIEFAEAVTDLQVWKAKAADLLCVLSRDVELARRCIALLANQNQRLEQQIEHRLLLTLSGRIAHVLLELDQRRDGQPFVPLTNAELAKIVGASRETVTRILGSLSSRGIIAQGYRRLQVLDSDGLRREISSTADASL